MSLKRNIAANYASQLYVTLIGILLLPLYIQYLGKEAYGLIGFFSMLQSWFLLLDLGLSPTVARESARFKSGVVAAVDFRRLIRALNIIFLSIAALGGTLLYLSAGLMSAKWLKVTALPIADVVLSLKLIAFCVAVRWLCGLYRGIISGSEALVWLSGMNSFIATLRFVLVIPVMYCFGYTILVFFCYQALVALLELVIFVRKSILLLPELKPGDSIGWSIRPVRPVLGFALTVAGTATLWIAATQLDKLILSTLLPLADYGVFMLVVSVASGVLVFAGPVSSALMPRLSILFAQQQQHELVRIYRDSTEFVVAVVGAVTLSLMLCAEPLLFAWTGDAEMAAQAATTLAWYSLGNGLLTLAGFPYYLQYAAGKLRLHVIGHLLLFVTLLPAMFFAVQLYGMAGASYVWAGINFCYLVFWAAVIHHHFALFNHWNWLWKNIIKLLLPAVIIAWLISDWISWPTHSRGLSLGYTLLCSSMILACTLCSSTVIRRLAGQFFLKKAV